MCALVTKEKAISEQPCLIFHIYFIMVDDEDIRRIVREEMSQSSSASHSPDIYSRTQSMIRQSVQSFSDGGVIGGSSNNSTTTSPAGGTVVIRRGGC